MLDLVDAFLGSPSSQPFSISFPPLSLIAHSSADTVILLEAPSLRLVQTLAFSEAFLGSTSHIAAIAVDKLRKLIVAAADNRVSVWSTSVSDGSAWRVHSTLLVSEPVLCLDVRSEHIVVGTTSGLTLFRLDESGDLPTWRKLWFAYTSTPAQVAFSPTMVFIASALLDEPEVKIHSVRTQHERQTLFHPRRVHALNWREGRTRHSEEHCLYTRTVDSVVRVFKPVIDAPSRLQLHAALDRYSFQPGYDDSDDEPSLSDSVSSGPIFWLDRDVLAGLLSKEVIGPLTSEVDQGRIRKLKDLAEDDWELFGYICKDGSFVVRVLTNIDRRPPTLLRQFTLFQMASQSLRRSRHLLILPSTSPSSSAAPCSHFTLVTSNPIRAHEVHTLAFMDGAAGTFKRVARGPRFVPKETLAIQGFIRTPEGNAIAALRHGGGGEIYLLDRARRVRPYGHWNEEGQVVLFNNGLGIAIFSKDVLTVHLFEANAREPSITLTTPHTPTSPPLLLTVPSSSRSHIPILSVSPTSISIFELITDLSPPELLLRSTGSLPLSPAPEMILPVDPMAWSHKVHRSGSISSPPLSSPKHAKSTAAHPAVQDALISISDDGFLKFWAPDVLNDVWNGWLCTGSIHTGRKGIRLARCSSAKKTALVSVEAGEESLTIWDSKESEFSSGLEYSHVFNEAINDLDWTSTDDRSDAQSILAVGFAHHVVLLSQQRMTYFDQEAAWAIIGQVDISPMTPYSILDSIWLAGGSLFIGAHHQILHFGELPPPEADVASKASSNQLSLFERVAKQNGPLEDYHPQMLLQCLLWDKVELVKNVIVKLNKTLEIAEVHGGEFVWSPFPVEQYTEPLHAATKAGHVRNHYSYLFDAEDANETEGDEDVFSRTVVDRLIQRLEKTPIAHLSVNERAHLIVLIQTTLQIDEQRRSLDANGLRYLISMRSFYLINERHAAENSKNNGSPSLETLGVRHRIRYRDIVWAFFSQSQEILLSASTNASGGKMLWKDARALGVFLWLESIESLKSQAEIIARNQYMAGDDRDPVACCLLYFALGKVKLVHGLWKQAAWHPEQKVMLKFLSNDFENPRWRTAALKNAFALLSKQRFEYAAAFFLLGGSLKDAVNVCLRQLKDFQLAVALARIVENGDDGPVLEEILSKTVIPIAFKDGNRWLACWAFWKLHRRDLSVRILLTPLQDIAAILDIQIPEIGNPHYDDPSLALLFLQLKSKTLQTVKGTTEISGRTEFNFVLQIARVFCRMGCHTLALDLVKHWTFDRITPPNHANQEPPSIDAVTQGLVNDGILGSSHPPPVTRPGFGGRQRRESSLVIDMDIPSLPTTRPTSPRLLPTSHGISIGSASPKPLDPVPDERSLEIDSASVEMQAKRTGLGNLMKSAKKDVKIAEFDMNAFF